MMAAVAILSGSGCSNKGSMPSGGNIPEAKAAPASQLDIPVGKSQVVHLPNGADIVVHNIAGTKMFKVEGTFADDYFLNFKRTISTWSKAEKKAAHDKEIAKVYGAIAKAGLRVIPQSGHSEQGFFTFLMEYNSDLFGALKRVNFEQPVLFDPIVIDIKSLGVEKAVADANMGAVADPRASTSGFSGLERVHAPEFVKQAQADIGGGAVVDGSSVNIGITDTGITYNHPTFLGADGQPRIRYLKDYTSEGRIYFNLASTIKVTAPADGSAEDLTVDAQVIAAPKLPSLPAGDSFNALSGLQIKVSPDLKAILTAANTTARLGVMLEDDFNGGEESSVVDINGNGSTTDKFFAFLVPGATPDQDVIYIDMSGTGDFRGVKPMGDWNKTHTMMTALSEKFGFDIHADQLPTADGKSTVDVRTASIVGFDPGNHGSHVSGIAAGRQTILNDSPDTLARGVAPAANIYLNRVCANNGGCDATEAFIDLATTAGVDVINMSLGGLNPFNDGYGVEETLINRLTETNNVLFSVSAGNSGPGRQTIGSPSTARLALSVGASASKELIQRQYQWDGTGGSPDDDDFMLFFSSRGPLANGGFKPNITAPGTELSSVELNAPAGNHAGLDVYWGTSMAAPTATGSYALFLDGIRKYNKAHADKALPTDAATLRMVLIASARPFDVSSFDPSTGAKSAGQYTWIDEGTGMIDLLAAWKLLFLVRDSQAPSPIKQAGKPIEPDYAVFTSAVEPNGIKYDGSRSEIKGTPAFASGVYLDYKSASSAFSVYVSRNLPAQYLSGADAGDLNTQLVDTVESFALKTVMYGSDKAWVKAGTLDSADCASSISSNMTLIGRGAEMSINKDGTGVPNPYSASGLEVCVDRATLGQLPPGDHGALIYAYRTVNGNQAPLPSFIVPVYVTVPNKTLGNTTGYDASGTVTSFGVNRNYVSIPAGTSVVRVTLEVPPVKTTRDGQLAAGETCSAVELMANLGSNSAAPPLAPTQSPVVVNCDSNAAPVTDDSKRTLTFSVNNPPAGLWDLDIFGLYRYPKSSYRLRVDYITAQTSAATISGPVAALNGTLTWTLQDSSVALAPDSSKSSFELDGLTILTHAVAVKDGTMLVQNPLGTMRAYPAATQSVTITIGNSPGNDIDLYIVECDPTAKDDNDASCDVAGLSAGPTDQESVTFTPDPTKVYAARVAGSTVVNDPKFDSTETIQLTPELGSVTVTATSKSAFSVAYGMSAQQQASSKLLTHDLFLNKGYGAEGILKILSADGTLLSAVPVQISVATPK
jgi:hypothetical protein